MPRIVSNDDTQADSLKLLARYRELCELVGGYRATHGPVPRTVSQQIKDIEGELQTRLWLAGKPSEQRASGQASQRSRADSNLPLPLGDLTVASSVASRPDQGGRGEGRPRAAGDKPPALQDAPGQGEGRPQPPTPSIQHSTHHSSLITHDSPQSLNGVAEVYSDGSCLGNPGPGGYGTIVRVHGRQEKEISGGKARTTNNEMELTGAIEGLKVATAMGASEITVVSDSEYLVKGMRSWMKGWLRNGWKTRTGDPVKNKALWEELYRLTQGKAVTWNWVAGHAGHPENERCNTLAVAAAQQAARLPEQKK